MKLSGAVAQLGERLVCNQEATGSIPVSSTKSAVNSKVAEASEWITFWTEFLR